MTLDNFVKSYLSAIYNRRKIIWNKKKKIKQYCPETEIFDNSFCVIFTAIMEVLFLEGILGTIIFLHPTLIS